MYILAPPSMPKNFFRWWWALLIVVVVFAAMLGLVLVSGEECG